MAATTCGRLVWRKGVDRPCGQSVGLTRWTDVIGLEHAACHAHVAVMQSLYPPAEPRDEVEFAKWWADREDTWTLA